MKPNRLSYKKVAWQNPRLRGCGGAIVCDMNMTSNLNNIERVPCRRYIRGSMAHMIARRPSRQRMAREPRGVPKLLHDGKSPLPTAPNQYPEAAGECSYKGTGTLNHAAPINPTPDLHFHLVGPLCATACMPHQKLSCVT